MRFKDAVKAGFGMYVGLRLAGIVDKLLNLMVNDENNVTTNTKTEEKSNNDWYYQPRKKGVSPGLNKPGLFAFIFFKT